MRNGSLSEKRTTRIFWAETPNQASRKTIRSFMSRRYCDAIILGVMNRRALISLPLLPAAAAATSGGLRLSIRVEPLFPGLSLAKQIERVAEAGYSGYEFGDWRSADPKEIVPLQRSLGIQCVNIVGNRS